MEWCAWFTAHRTSCAEVAGFVFGVINVYLTVREKIWSWPIGILNAAFSAVVFQEHGLYSDFGLQFVYIAMSIYGWHQWLYGGAQKTELHVTSTPARTAGILLVLGLIGWVALYNITSRIPGTRLPKVDAALVASSLVAQWMMTRKLRETWLLWIAINIAYVATFIYRGLNLYAVLNTVYGILAVLGHIEWDAIFRPDLTRIVLTGSESTGKTTLAAQLAAHYGVEFVPEFVREYAVLKGEPVVMSDHGAIARGQMALENAYAERANALLFQDADLLSTVAYYTHYSGGCPQWIVDEAISRRPHLYILANIDVPWVADGIRDRGDRREEMHQVFVDTLARLHAPYVELSGLGHERLQNAIKIVDAFISKKSAR